MKIRQKLLFLYLSDGALDSRTIGWSIYDGTGVAEMNSDPRVSVPYGSVLEAMKDGWRVVQFPTLQSPAVGREYETSYLKFEFILEKMIDVDESEVVEKGIK